MLLNSIMGGDYWRCGCGCWSHDGSWCNGDIQPSMLFGLSHEWNIGCRQRFIFLFLFMKMV
ncbi:hypothetical protein Hanom_Chr08g00733241 [Helianthus anomalus]